VNVADLCRLEGFSMAMFYKWRVKCGGMETSDAKPPRELEAENAGGRRCLPKRRWTTKH